jgi:hypothetical protein
VIEPKDAQFKIDEKIVLKCRTTLRTHKPSERQSHNLKQRQPRPNIHWYKDNEPIRSTSLYRNSNNEDPSMRKIDIETKQEGEDNLLNSVLVIHNARIEDSGKYKCIYENIQEQVTVKVIYDCKRNFFYTFLSKSKLTTIHIFFFEDLEYKKYLSSGGINVSFKQSSQMAILLLFNVAMFVLVEYIF